MSQTRTRERGATLLVVTFVSTFLLIPIVGTCIDGAILYWVKARLATAADAAALATARSLNVGQTASSQLINATATGRKYFAANFPPGVLGTTVNGPEITIDETQLHKRIVTVSMSASVPLIFGKLLGFSNGTVSAKAQATRRDANIVMVLDRSGSMNANGSCSALVASAQNFVNQFVDGRDRLGLVTFQTGANVDYPASLNFKSGSPNLNTVLGTLVCGGSTGTAQGLYLGFDQIKNAINQPGALNVIVLFTDGQPNAVVADFNVKRATDFRYDAVNTGSEVWTGASNCLASTLRGVITDSSHETASDISGLNPTGYTSAVLSESGVPITDGSAPDTISAAGCVFPNADWSYSVYGRRDIEAIPIVDAYGNSTVDGGYIGLDYFPAGHTYAGLIRPDMPRTVRWAAFNATDSMAKTVRNDGTYTTIIYTIGLQGNESMAMSQDFMERVANDPRASNYDSTKPQGQFILATNNPQLSRAFQQIASQILRLSQ